MTNPRAILGGPRSIKTVVLVVITSLGVGGLAPVPAEDPAADECFPFVDAYTRHWIILKKWYYRTLWADEGESEESDHERRVSAEGPTHTFFEPGKTKEAHLICEEDDVES